MSPWELIGVYLVLPVLLLGGWLHHRYEADGPSIPEFEAWCKSVRPILFAMAATAEKREAFTRALVERLGAAMEVEHHEGRFPWPSYIFKLHVEVDEARSALRVRAVRGSVRLKREHRIDLGKALDGALREATRGIDGTQGVRAIWFHTELREGDEMRGEARRDRGWLAREPRRDVGGLRTNEKAELELVESAPTWVRGG